MTTYVAGNLAVTAERALRYRATRAEHVLALTRKELQAAFEIAFELHIDAARERSRVELLRDALQDVYDHLDGYEEYLEEDSTHHWACPVEVGNENLYTYDPVDGVNHWNTEEALAHCGCFIGQIIRARRAARRALDTLGVSERVQHDARPRIRAHDDARTGSDRQEDASGRKTVQDDARRGAETQEDARPASEPGSVR